MNTRRPRSLSEVADRVALGAAFDPTLREFLDAFYGDPEVRRSGLIQPPRLLGPLEDAYLAATAEHLAVIYGIDVPTWTATQGNGLNRPFFAGGLESLKATLLVESPTAFRRRLIFVSRNALDRAIQRSERATG